MNDSDGVSSGTVAEGPAKVGAVTKKALWWVVGEGLVYREFPASYLTLLAENRTLKEAGYKKESLYGIPGNFLASAVYFHETEDLYLVAIYRSGEDYQGYARIFVTGAEKDDFFVKWYLDFLVRIMSIASAFALGQIGDVLTSFVQHATGQVTADE
jgi:hypothetical protein